MNRLYSNPSPLSSDSGGQLNCGVNQSKSQNGDGVLAGRILLFRVGGFKFRNKARRCVAEVERSVSVWPWVLFAPSRIDFVNQFGWSNSKAGFEAVCRSLALRYCSKFMLRRAKGRKEDV